MPECRPYRTLLGRRYQCQRVLLPVDLGGGGFPADFTRWPAVHGISSRAGCVPERCSSEAKPGLPEARKKSFNCTEHTLVSEYVPIFIGDPECIWLNLLRTGERPAPNRSFHASCFPGTVGDVAEVTVLPKAFPDKKESITEIIEKSFIQPSGEYCTSSGLAVACFYLCKRLIWLIVALKCFHKSANKNNLVAFWESAKIQFLRYF